MEQRTPVRTGSGAGSKGQGRFLSARAETVVPERQGVGVLGTEPLVARRSTPNAQHPTPYPPLPPFPSVSHLFHLCPSVSKKRPTAKPLPADRPQRGRRRGRRGRRGRG